MGLFGDMGGDIGDFFSDITFENGTPGRSFGALFGAGFGPIGAWAGQQIGSGIDQMLTPPDYSGPLDAATQQLLEEKRRRANEANRKEIRGSQLARLFLTEDGTTNNTPSNSFMG
jgi:hypothetical protein